MDSAAETLLIVVSSVLSVFLILSSIALIFFIRLLKQLRRIAERAENVAESVETAAENFERKAGSLAALKLVANIIDSVSKMRKKG